MKIKVILLSTLLLISGIWADETAKINVSGSYLGLFNFLDQQNAASSHSKRQQFDIGANINFEWQFHPNITGVIQFQGSTGEGSLGLANSQPSITDLNIVWQILDDFNLTLGSFDTPFGEKTNSLSNNANTFANTFFLNSLFYSAFAGTPIGTLNTVGLMTHFKHKYYYFTMAVTNGTDESAINSDGNVEFVSRITSRLFNDRLLLAGSMMFSDDSSASGSTGSGSEYSAWMLEAMIPDFNSFSVNSYFGTLTYNDGITMTKDDVQIYMLELLYKSTLWSAGIRISGWSPKDSNGDRAGFSPFIPNPGLSLDLGSIIPADQKVMRIQLGGGYHFAETLMFKIELLMDKYDRKTNGKDSNTIGVISGLNMLF